MNRFTHFELATGDLEKTAAFYREVFGWDVQKWDGPVEYWLVTTGDRSTPGINGGLMHTDGHMVGTINTMEVDDIDEIIAKALAHGAEIVLEKGAIPGVGYQAYIKDNSGIIIGLHQPDPTAGMEAASRGAAEMASADMAGMDPAGESAGAGTAGAGTQG
jgi:predicted enzyme related to lactoylglutathione lyase